MTLGQGLNSSSINLEIIRGNYSAWLLFLFEVKNTCRMLGDASRIKVRRGAGGMKAVGVDGKDWAGQRGTRSVGFRGRSSGELLSSGFLQNL